MNKIAVLALVLAIGFTSCKNAEKEIEKLRIAKQYYHVLDHSNPSKIRDLVADSIVTVERGYGYEQTFSKEQYVEWMKWDSVFNPTYQILEIEQAGDSVRARISKIDTRISFLHEKPIVTSQVIRFDEGKISSIETTGYPEFDELRFLKNRSDLINWIDEFHPELNGFIYDQTEKGALNYLEAITLYENRR